MASLTAPIRAVLEAVRTAWRHLRDGLHRMRDLVHGRASRAWSRHTTRVAADRTYRRTLSTAVAALVSTLLPHPAIAAAVAVWVADPPRPRLRPVPPQSRYGIEDEDDDGDDPPPWRPRPTLWDTLDRP
jgi:hypothetical protein